MSFSAYPRYHATDVEWLPKAPQHWQIAPLKRWVRLVTTKASEQRNPIGLENIEGWTGRLVATDSEFDGQGVAFRSGDVLLGKLRPYLAKVHCAEEPGEAIGDFHVLRPAPSLNGKFLKYWLLNPSCVDVVNSFAFGSKMPRSSWESIGALKLPLPPMAEQVAIVKFLEEQSRFADDLISRVQCLVDLLEEERHVVTSNAVTRGLNPDAPMKPSGVGHWPQVPSHWKILRLKHLSPRISGRLVYQPAQYFQSEGVPFLMGNNVTERGIDWDEVKLISPSVNEKFSHHALKAGDVITVRVGAPGLTCVVPTEADGLNCGSLMIIRRADHFDSEWLAHVMNSSVVRAQIAAVQYGAAQEQINITDAVNFLIPTPPRVEQTQLAAFIRGLTARFDALTRECNAAIRLLEEHRVGTISAVVTGRIDVRGVINAEVA